jgi:cytochrome b
MQTNNMVKVWDPLVRFFHWSLVIAFFTAYLSEDDFLTLHTYAGYTVLGLILFRIIWGNILRIPCCSAPNVIWGITRPGRR